MKINEIVEAMTEMYSWIGPDGQGYNMPTADHGRMIYQLSQQGKFADESKDTYKVAGGTKSRVRELEDGSPNHLRFLTNAAIKQGWIQVSVNTDGAHIQLNNGNTSPASMKYLFKILTKFQPYNIKIEYSNDADQILSRDFSSYQKAMQDLQNRT